MAAAKVASVDQYYEMEPLAVQQCTALGKWQLLKTCLANSHIYCPFEQPKNARVYRRMAAAQLMNGICRENEYMPWKVQESCIGGLSNSM